MIIDTEKLKAACDAEFAEWKKNNPDYSYNDKHLTNLRTIRLAEELAELKKVSA